MNGYEIGAVCNSPDAEQEKDLPVMVMVKKYLASRMQKIKNLSTTTTTLYSTIHST